MNLTEMEAKVSYSVPAILSGSSHAAGPRGYKWRPMGGFRYIDARDLSRHTQLVSQSESMRPSPDL